MSETLNRKNRLPFTQVSNELLTSTKISLKAKGLYAYMMSKPDGWNFTIKSMSKQLKEGPDSIRSGLNELKEFNAIEYTKHSDGTGTYTIDTQPKLENPNLDNPNMGNSNPNSNKDNTSNKDQYLKDEAVLLPEWLDIKAWSEWNQYRKEIKKKLTPTAIKQQIEFLEKHKSNHAAIIKQSIQNTWTGLFELNKKPKTIPGNTKSAIQRVFRNHEETEAIEAEMM